MKKNSYFATHPIALHPNAHPHWFEIIGRRGLPPFLGLNFMFTVAHEAYPVHISQKEYLCLGYLGDSTPILWDGEAVFEYREETLALFAESFERMVELFQIKENAAGVLSLNPNKTQKIDAYAWKEAILGLNPLSGYYFSPKVSDEVPQSIKDTFYKFGLVSTSNAYWVFNRVEYIKVNYFTKQILLGYFGKARLPVYLSLQDGFIYRNNEFVNSSLECFLKIHLLTAFTSEYQYQVNLQETDLSKIPEIYYHNISTLRKILHEIDPAAFAADAPWTMNISLPASESSSYLQDALENDSLFSHDPHFVDFTYRSQ